MQTAAALRSADLVLGRYRPLRPLGSGGSGSVWLVRDGETGRDVALKVVERTGKAGSRAETRSRGGDAASPSALPACPCIPPRRRACLRRVRVRARQEPPRGASRGRSGGCSRDRGGRPGARRAWPTRCEGNRSPRREARHVMVEACDEVSTRLLDFGLARLDEVEGLTATGDVPGTLAYVAPERLEGGAGREARPTSGGSESCFGRLSPAGTRLRPRRRSKPPGGSRRAHHGLPRSARALPRELCATVDSMLSVEPRRRPPARRLAADLREGGELRAHRPHSAASRTALRERAAHALLAALAAGGATTLLPFFPRGWPLVLAVVAGLAALRSPLAGLAVALAAPVLPLGNLSLGLAIAYGVLAVTWVRPPRPGRGTKPPPGGRPGCSLRSGQFPFYRWPFSMPAVGSGGPSVPPPAFRSQLRSPCWPADRFRSPESHRARRVRSRARPGRWTSTATLYNALTAHPTLAVATVVLSLAAATADLAVTHGRWAIAGWGAALLSGALLVPAAFGGEPAPALSTTLFVWAATGLLALRLPPQRTTRDPPGNGQNARAG